MLAPVDPSDVGEWARKIVEVYMTWYTVFLSTNFAVLGYLFTKDSRSVETRAVKGLAALFILFNVMGSASTFLVGQAAGAVAPQVFSRLIHWAAASNMVGLLGNAVMWSYVMLFRRPSGRAGGG